MNQTDRMDRNGEGYTDLTAGTAYKNMQREKQKEKSSARRPLAV